MRWLCPKCRGGFPEHREACPADGTRLIENLAGLVLASRWGVERLLGVGGGGAAVWSAVGVATRSPVAVKVAPARDRIEALRFERAARVAALLDHPHVARVIEYDRVDDRHVLIMELLEGGTLQRRMQRNAPLAVADALHVIDQVLDVLEHAHGFGIVHRNLKPSNIFLEPWRGDMLNVKVVDWGTARLMGAERKRAASAAEEKAKLTITQTQQILGTPEYMAPEQIVGSPCDARTDLYAAGIVLYSLLAGRHPFGAKSRSEMYQAHLGQEAPPLPEGLDPRLDAIVRQALAKRPEDRWASANAMRVALAALRIGTSAEGATPPPVPAAAARRATQPTAPAHLTPPLAAMPPRPPRPPRPPSGRVEVPRVAATTGPRLGPSARLEADELAAPPAAVVTRKRASRRGLWLGVAGAAAAAVVAVVVALGGVGGDAAVAERGADIEVEAPPAAVAAASEGAPERPAETPKEEVAEAATEAAAPAIAEIAPVAATEATDEEREAEAKTDPVEEGIAPVAPPEEVAPARAAHRTPPANKPAQGASKPVRVEVARPASDSAKAAAASPAAVTPEAAPPAATPVPAAPKAATAAPPVPAAPAPEEAVAPAAPAAPSHDINKVLPFGPGMSRPVRIAGGQPKYTREALVAKVEGTMIVRCVIERDGSLSGCTILKPVAHMETAVMEALAAHRYQPIMVQGRARRVAYTFNFTFVMPR